MLIALQLQLNSWYRFRRRLSQLLDPLPGFSFWIRPRKSTDNFRMVKMFFCNGSLFLLQLWHSKLLILEWGPEHRRFRIAHSLGAWGAGWVEILCQAQTYIMIGTYLQIFNAHSVIFGIILHLLPGSGKGSQCEKIVEEFVFSHFRIFTFIFNYHSCCHRWHHLQW